jgi:hypothetical protein
MAQGPLELRRRVATSLDFGHDVVNRRAAKPTMPVTSIIGASRPVQAKETSQSVQTQFSLKNRERVPFEVLVSHSVDGDQ